jgi:diacylglycerol kinase family enzyme
MTHRTAFIFNSHAGRGFDAGWLATHRAAIEAIASGGPISVVDDGEQIRAAVQAALAQGCEAVVAGGGDGTLNAVASCLVGRPVKFGVLPLGTLNHFAKDLGLPLEPVQALQCIAAGHTLDVDVAEVNGHYFLNNSSIGLYVDLVRDREQQQLRLGRGKWAAFAWALVGALRRYPFMTVQLMVDGKAYVHRTPFVFVGNNVYCTEGLQIGQRASLTGGQLSVYVAERAGRRRLFYLGLRGLAGKLRQERDFRQLAASDLVVRTSHRSLHVATDGETRRLDTPLHYRTNPGALRVFVPAPAPAAASGAEVEAGA